MVRVTGNPQPMEQNGRFPSNGDDSSFLAIFSAPFEHSGAPAFEVTVRTKSSQQILSTLNQQRAELFVARLADSELLFDRAGLVTTRRQTEICRDISGMSEAAGASYREHVLKCGDRTHAADLA